MKNGGKNKSVAFIILFSISKAVNVKHRMLCIHCYNIFPVLHVRYRCIDHYSIIFQYINLVVKINVQ